MGEARTPIRDADHLRDALALLDALLAAEGVTARIAFANELDSAIAWMESRRDG